jgi:hypothetical protein
MSRGPGTYPGPVQGPKPKSQRGKSVQSAEGERRHGCAFLSFRTSRQRRDEPESRELNAPSSGIKTWRQRLVWKRTPGFTPSPTRSLLTEANNISPGSWYLVYYSVASFLLHWRRLFCYYVSREIGLPVHCIHSKRTSPLFKHANGRAIGISF